MILTIDFKLQIANPTEERKMDRLRRLFKLRNKGKTSKVKITVDDRPTIPPVRRLIPPTSREEILCVVCFMNKKCMLIRPCNHACLCNECTTLLQGENELKECPLCRGHVNHVERIYI